MSLFLKHADKLFDLLYIITLAMSYLLVYDLARVRQANVCREQMILKDVQLDTAYTRIRHGKVK